MATNHKPLTEWKGYADERFALICGYEAAKAGIEQRSTIDIKRHWGQDMHISGFQAGIEAADQGYDETVRATAQLLERELRFIGPIWADLQRECDLRTRNPLHGDVTFRFDNDAQARYFATIARFRGWALLMPKSLTHTIIIRHPAKQAA